MKTLRNKLTSALCTISWLCAYILCVALYSTFGLALMLSYSSVTGGIRHENVALFSLIAPIILLVIIGMGILAFLQKRNMRTRQFFGKSLLIIVGYLALPILFNGISMAFTAFDWEAASNVAFALRFWSFLIVPILASVMVSAYARLSSLRWNRRMKTPPTNPPQPPFDKQLDRRPDNDTNSHLLRVSIA